MQPSTHSEVLTLGKEMTTVFRHLKPCKDDLESTHANWQPGTHQPAQILHLRQQAQSDQPSWEWATCPHTCITVTDKCPASRCPPHSYTHHAHLHERAWIFSFTRTETWHCAHTITNKNTCGIMRFVHPGQQSALIKHRLSCPAQDPWKSGLLFSEPCTN